MRRNEIPAFTFAIALSFFALVYAISASGAWHSAGRWIREYQTLILGMTLLLVVLIIGAFVWRRVWEARHRSGPFLGEAADHLRRANDIKDACGALHTLILAGIANEAAAAENPRAYFEALRRCDAELGQFRRLAVETPQSGAKLSELQFIQGCDSFLDIARQIAPGGHVDFTWRDPGRRLQFNVQLNQCYDSLVDEWRTTTERLDEQIRGLDALLFDIDTRMSTSAR